MLEEGVNKAAAVEVAPVIDWSPEAPSVALVLALFFFGLLMLSELIVCVYVWVC